MTNNKIRLSIIIGQNLNNKIVECRKERVLNISEICRKAIERELKKLKKNTP